MSILIEGIELPKENQRGLWVVIHADGTVEYDSGDEGWKTLKQAAFPVPPLSATAWINEAPTIIPAEEDE